MREVWQTRRRNKENISKVFSLSALFIVPWKEWNLDQAKSCRMLFKPYLGKWEENTVNNCCQVKTNRTGRVWSEQWDVHFAYRSCLHVNANGVWDKASVPVIHARVQLDHQHVKYRQPFAAGGFEPSGRKTPPSFHSDHRSSIVSYPDLNRFDFPLWLTFTNTVCLCFLESGFE